MTAAATRMFCRSTFPPALLGSLLLWAALPPLALGWLAWIAPVPWLLLIVSDRLPGRRPYGVLYLAGLAFWLASIHWIRLPCPPWTYFGLTALAGYLAVYLPVFIGLTRVAVHRLAVPVCIAAPVVWTGLELARAHLLTGFMMGSIAHAQTKWLALVQISDTLGEYGVDFVILFVAAAITGLLPRRFIPTASEDSTTNAANGSTSGSFAQRIVPAVAAAVLLVATIVYGTWRLAQSERISKDKANSRGPRIALIQGNSLAEWKLDPEKERQIMDEYLRLSRDAIARAANAGDSRAVDLVVWPETMFRTPLVSFDPNFQMPPGQHQSPQEIASYGPHDLAAAAAQLHTNLLVGIDRIHYGATDPAGPEKPPAFFNSAVLVGRDGKIVGTYDKVHRVMFGEYIPFADWLPFLYRFTPISGGIEAGAGPAALPIDTKFTVIPDICYETAIPHVIRRQVKTIESQGKTPTVLINLTNDAWFWGSSELDMHLACDVYRAVESRLPLVVAANGGISAWIDRVGRMKSQSPRQKPDFILADIELGQMPSPYVQFGDWFAGICLTCCALTAMVAWKFRNAN